MSDEVTEEVAAPAAVADWALDETLKAIQGGAQDKDALQAATGLGPTDLRRALEALVEDGVVRETDDGWEADMTATPARVVDADALEGISGPGVWEPPPATGPVTLGVPWTSPEEAEEAAEQEERASDEAYEARTPPAASVSSEADGDVYAAKLDLRISYQTPDDPVEMSRMLATRLEELVTEVFGLEAAVTVDAIDKTERVYRR